VFYLLFQFGKVDNTVYKVKFGLCFPFWEDVEKQTSFEKHPTKATARRKN